MATNGSPATIISCPGKVLIAGGYLVLDPAHQGFVISTPSRFYTVVQPAIDVTHDTPNSFRISVRSPQFLDGKWEYEAKKVEGDWTLAEIKEDATTSSNPFVFLSIKSALQLSHALSSSSPHSSLLITIVGSNDFYSQSREDATPIPFAPLNVTIRNVHKTGLGSSAAMVTSLTSALFLHWTESAPRSPDDTFIGSSPRLPSSFPQSHLPPPPDKATLTLIHNLAQYVHSLAQGKVGSGFDVSAAVWGSQVYRRFSVACLGSLDQEVSNSRELLKRLSPLMNDLWNKQESCAFVLPFALPPRTKLILADVDAGSNTPSMVGKVMAWKKKDPVGSEALWKALKQSNAAVAEVFGNLTRLEREDKDNYPKIVDRLSSKSGDEWSKEGSTYFSAAREHILTTRKYMRQMGEASGVPIEPPEQTKLLDACSALPGVIGAGVPGAGGYDAIWVLVLSGTSSRPEEDVEALLMGYNEMSVRTLSRNAWVKGGDAQGESGLLRESLEEVEGLKATFDRTM